MLVSEMQVRDKGKRFLRHVPSVDKTPLSW